ncbi:MAG: translation elongation factor Ts [Myxococcaceae bacterium]|jgi:elongation factor Ts|nr:translation elongation factor Ts [Myxococcaceae bacterium]
MAEISAQMVKDLREKTGAGMMDCKKALAESGGDFAKAEEWLRKKGISKAASKGARVAAEGLVGVEVSNGNKLGVLVELNSETDFVARNDEFVKLLSGLVAHVARHAPTSLDNLHEQAWTDGKKVKDAITEKIATIGENISVRRFERFATEGGLGQYLHANGRIAAMVEVLGSDKPEVAAVAKELAMQVAAMNPRYVSREQVPAEVLEKEREIYREEIRNPPPPAPGEIRNPNKKPPPEERWPMIIEGKLNKFFENVCLVDQVSIKNDKQKVKDLVAEAGKAVGATLTVGRVVRYEVGEGIEKKKDDLAAEVAKTLGQA